MDPHSVEDDIMVDYNSTLRPKIDDNELFVTRT